MRAYISIILLLFSASRQQANAGTPPTDTVVRWSSTGGGWRAMAACMGWANVFRQAGLFTEETSHFDAIATTSGASWFSTQLFYSEAFYNHTVMADPYALFDFVTDWMSSYYSITRAMGMLDVSSSNSMMMDGINVSDITSNEDDLSPIAFAREFYDLFRVFHGDWAWFIQQMLETTAHDYGHTHLSQAVANAENRLAPLQNTNLLVQTALVPNSRVRMGYLIPEMNETMEESNFLKVLAGLFTPEEPKDLLIYTGPMTDTNNQSHYTALLSATYVVNETFAGFTYSTQDTASDQDLMTYASARSPDFGLEDWDEFITENANLTLSVEDAVRMGIKVDTGVMPRPFGGEAATVAQLSAISSAVAGGVSPTAPSAFAQIFANQRSTIRETRGAYALPAFDAAMRNLYKSTTIDNVAVCSQWPKPCLANEGLFVDGGYADNPAVATNIGQYHTSADADLSKTLKLILTNANTNWDLGYNLVQIQQYFAADFNEGVAPGDRIWLPEHYAPIRSTQIFREFMDRDKLGLLLHPLEGTQMTTAVIKATTLDNPAFGVREGQVVEILLLNLNTPITSVVAGPSAIEDNTIPLAQMAQDIASNQELVRRVHDFVYGTGGQDDTSPSVEVTRGSTADTAEELSGHGTANPASLEPPPQTPQVGLMDYVGETPGMNSQGTFNENAQSSSASSSSLMAFCASALWKAALWATLLAY